MYVVVHGGAGGPPDEPADRLSTLADAADTAADAEGPLDAVLAAVRPLERDPRFNAGVGGAVQSDGVVRTEAGLVTDDGTTGAACSMAGVAHAADVARVVATDGDRLAAATSTAGRWFALAGRVGDVPQIGAGFYADGRGGASATGEGEAIARFGLARRAVDLLETFGPRQAAEEALAEFERATDGQAGVVVLDHAGHVGSEYNTAAMQTSRAGPD
ncbi:isoaspartyl peptidase/L-asparaginase [Halomicroarcula sp. S1AR25-4]|uniref:isoaspartyl peptidase/L-asparaginase n=1 Tax=Haloarcula sp. S1AR25-4 TaxID=2950538 RepID=UPI002875C3A2|nr:isoaspartyl peptidase/L-asparaginase [Halomicroarcula sp. S1AR25-4]MDS0278311.1 isoaspartyl peptidase/L-asparaginase [Halomicroarcula sp. S1AR25-4]